MSIGGSVFTGCKSLISIIVEAGNTKYDSRDNCNAIIETESNTLIVGCQNTIIHSKVTSIGDYAFFGCSNLTSIVLPNSVTSIGYAAFKGSSGLTSVIIGNGIKTIDRRAFASCTALTDVYCYAENIPEIGSEAFKDSPIENATLHVPAGSVEAYKAAEPWNQFKAIVAIGSAETDEGDANGDGEIDVADIDFVIEHIGEPINDTNKASDVNGDGEINVADVDYIIERIK